ncbi:MAG: NAD(P)H-dependent glycerol-3-phosphate dehydrogenase [Hyphomonadaceae bacterium]|nr:NAD(P)H-dependent glycerol-3-phosphate dehydrogenase [Hyphomonadaceae bacterium]
MTHPPHPIDRVFVLGAGAWGTALAQVAAQAGRAVTLWAYEAEVVDAIAATAENPVYLPGQLLHPGIRATSDLALAGGADAVLAAPPAQFMRRALADLAPHLRPGAPVALCAKGVEQGSLALMTDVLKQTIPHAGVAVLSGPGFARDVAAGKPTATTIACADPAQGAAWVAALGLPTFRPYLTDDLVGAEIGGAVKNVIAIACGIAEGRALGEGARAALITRGFAEMVRLGRAMGARLETLNGLCGLGDLVLTCVSRSSRNTALGAALGEGASLAAAQANRRSVAEGVASAPAVAALAQRCGVEMPICAAVDAVLASRLSVDDAIEALLSRPFRAEGA